MRESVASAEADVNSDQRGQLSGSQWGSLVGTSGLNPNNAISNGDFPNTTGWTPVFATATASDNIYSLTGNGGSENARTQYTTNLTCVSGDKIFIKFRSRATNSNATTLVAYLYGTTGGSNYSAVTPVLTPTQNTWYPLSGIVTLTAAFTGFVRIAPVHSYVDAATANRKVMEIDGTNGNGVICVNLTKDYPSQVATMTDAELKTWADANIPFYSNANAYTSVMYDQSGNALQAVQTTAANQPLIVMSGNLLDGVKFDDVNDSLVVAKTPVINDITNLSVMGTVRFNGAGGSGYGRIFDKSNGTTNTLGRFFTMDSGSMRLIFRQYFTSGNIQWETPNNSVTFNKNYVLCLVYNNSANGNNPIIYINGISRTLTKTDAASSADPSSDATLDLYIGNRASGILAGNNTTKDFIMDNKLWTPNTVSRLTQNAFRRHGFTA
jgi:hypothetical protein